MTNAEDGQNPPYTDAEKTLLRALWADPKLSHDEIAERLCRSKASVKVKASQMRLGRRPKEWTFGSAVLRKRQAQARGAAE